MKKFFRKFRKKLKPLLLISVVLVALVLVGGYFLIFTGDDDSETAASTTQGASSKAGPGSDDEITTQKNPTPKVDPGPPAGKEFTIDSDRDEKDYAIATAIGAVKTPARIAVRIGAAPKQPVTVDANIVCTLRNEGQKSNMATFQVTPPVTRELKLPASDPVSCTASVGVRLTQAGEGRIKVFLVATRRGDA